jgi:hypothetical protein
MELPSVSPVGVPQVPEGYRTTPRVHRPLVRIAALVTLTAFLGVGVVTTVLSLARYCLTSWAGTPVSLASPEVVDTPRFPVAVPESSPTGNRSAAASRST